MIELVSAIAIGFLLGIVFAIVVIQKHTVGNLRIDQSDPYDQPYLFLEKTVDEIRFRDYVILKIVDKNYIPRN